MDPIDPIIGGAIGTALMGAIGTLWVAWQKALSDKDAVRDKMQDKIDGITQKAIDAINSSKNQADSFSGALSNMMMLVTKQGDQWILLKEEILRILRDGK